MNLMNLTAIEEAAKIFDSNPKHWMDILSQHMGSEDRKLLNKYASIELWY